MQETQCGPSAELLIKPTTLKDFRRSPLSKEPPYKFVSEIAPFITEPSSAIQVELTKHLQPPQPPARHLQKRLFQEQNILDLSSTFPTSPPPSTSTPNPKPKVKHQNTCGYQKYARLPTCYLPAYLSGYLPQVAPVQHTTSAVLRACSTLGYCVGCTPRYYSQITGCTLSC